MATSSATAPVTVTGLAASTDYQVLAFLDVLNDTISYGSRIEYFTTNAVPSSAQFAMTFQQSVAANQMPSIAAALAPLMSASFDQITYGYMNQTLARRLDNSTTPPPLTVTSTTFTFSLLPDRFVDKPVPSAQTALSPQALADLRDSLVARGITNELTSFTQQVTTAPLVPAWERPVEILSYNNVSATVTFKANVAGVSCCVALEEASPALLAEQVLLGYSFNWTQAIQVCTPSNMTMHSNQVTLSALQPDTNYYISCVAADSLPIWPTLMQYSEAVPMPFIPLHTLLNMEVDEVMAGAAWLALATLVVL